MSDKRADKRKLPSRDSRTIIIRYKHAAVMRLSRSLKQTKVTSASAMQPDNK